MRNKLFCIIFCLPLFAFGQKNREVHLAISFPKRDTTPYTLFKDRWIFYADLGYASAPFSIKYTFYESIDKLKFLNNFRTILGVGVSYKWFALRLGVPLPGNVRPISKYGKTIPFNLGFDFTVKKTFCDVDFRNYQGYVIKDAKNYKETLTNLKPNEIRGNTNATSFSANVWYFHDKHFKMSALRGKTGHYDREVKTWYVKTSLNIFGINNGNSSIVPQELLDSTNSKVASSSLSSVDIGIIPGYAYVNKINNWQFSVIAGLGGAIQSKFYASEGTTRGFLGLSPRIDFRFIGGYTVPRYFVFIVTDFDNKSIRFNEFVYRQSFYSVKIVGGIRLDPKEKKSKNKL